MELRIPKTLEAYTIQQADRVLRFIDENTEPTPGIIFKCGMVSAVTGIPIEKVKKIDMSSINEAYTIIDKSLNRNQREPKKVITVEGQRYVFESNLAHKSWDANRFIDSETISDDMDSFPAKMMAVMYVEEGKKYGDIQLAERAKLFEKHMSGADYLDAIAFFLRKSQRLSPGYSVLQLARAKQKIRKGIDLIRQSRTSG